MGMFDHLVVNKDLLPIEQEVKDKILSDRVWQTKDFENILTEIYINNDGTLSVNEWKYESVPKEERPYPDDDGIKGIMGSLRRVDEHLVPLNYHGIVNFYGIVDGYWYEFNTKFTDGKLVNIELINTHVIEIKWWGYKHISGHYQVKRYFSEDDIEEAKKSPFCKQVYGPFFARGREDAIEKLKTNLE